MKKGIEVLNEEFVLDEFHIEKYIRKMARLESSSTEKEQEETVKYLQECIEKGRRTELEK